MTNTKATLLAQLAAISRRITQLSQCFSSKEFSVAIAAIGFDVNTEELFDHSFIIDFHDQEITTFFEQYCTRLCAERIRLQIALNTIDEGVK